MFIFAEDVKNSGVCDSKPNLVVVVICVTVASILVIALGVLAIVYVKRSGIIRSSGHRTLTSFENPVYEYENNLK